MEVLDYMSENKDLENEWLGSIAIEKGMKIISQANGDWLAKGRK